MGAPIFMFDCHGHLVYHRTWLIVKVNDEVCEYYRHLANLYNRTLCLNQPRDGAHITVIAGKYELIDDSHKHLWNKYQNDRIDFKYNISIGDDGEYFWLPVECERIEEIRNELGLKRRIPIPWHLTIGNLK